MVTIGQLGYAEELEVGSSLEIGRDNGPLQKEIEEKFTNISGMHCTLFFDPDHKYLQVTDTTSMNGTYLGGERLGHNEPTPFPPGQILELGRNNPRRQLSALRVEVSYG